METKTSKMKTIEQGRAEKAYQFVETAKKDSNIKWDEYKSGIRKLPIYIKTNGLGQALAFIQNRPNFPGIYQQISTWLQKEDFKHLVPKGQLMEVIVKMNSDEYRQVTVETLALLNWMRRFVDGMDKQK